MVEVAYAALDRQKIIALNVVQGTTAMQAVEASNIVAIFPEIDLDNVVLGVFSKQIKPDYVLAEKDRVEIYRPLIADPKEVRRKRAEKAKV